MFLLSYLAIFFDKQLLLNYLSLSFLDYKFNITFLKYFLTILCFLLFINAFNMLDGINGQASSYLIFILIIFIFNKIFLTLSIILIVATIFILILNFNNKLYLGSTGTLVLGFLISNLFPFLIIPLLIFKIISLIFIPLFKVNNYKIFIYFIA